MSNAGQVALDVVGTVVGFYLGGPTGAEIGFTLATAAGSVLFPTQLPSGPKITDNRTTTASVGDPVSFVFGKADVAGTVIWLAPYVQTTNSGGKGGPQQTTYQYNQSIAIGLCEGPIGGISRIWENGTIVYDVRPQQPANADLFLDAETDAAFASRLAISATYAETFTLYLGTESQQADPTIESIEGYGQVPGFRGLAYVVFPNRLLQVGQGWRHPSFKFEIASVATYGTPAPSTLLHLDGDYTDSALVPSIWTATGSNGFVSAGQPFGLAGLGNSSSGPKFGASCANFGYGAPISAPIVPGGALDLHDTSFTFECWAQYAGPVGGISANFFFTDAGLSADCFIFFIGQSGNLTAEAAGSAGYSGFSMLTNFRITADGLWHHVAFSVDLVNQIAQIWLDGAASGAVPFTPFTAPNPQPTFYIGGSPSGLKTFNGMLDEVRITRALVYPMDANFTPPAAPFTAGAGVVTVDAGSGVTLASIIQTVCSRASLTAVDVSDMEVVSVAGYAVSTLASASSILTPLRSVAFFDAVESQGVIKYQARGKPIVATLMTDDIGAYDESGGGHKAVPPSITTVRTQDEELPRSIRFKYKAVSRDYEDGEQLSPFRLATTAVHDVDVSSPLCLDDTPAARCAEILWADAWAGRTAYTLSVDQAWLALDAGDCIGVPVDGVIQRMRIVSDTNASAVLRKLSCVRDDGGAYISFAVASAPQRPAQILTFIAPTAFEFLDLPCLTDADSDPGFYIAAQRAAGVGQWGGAIAYQSLDGGVEFSQLFALPTEATIGTLAAAAPISAAYTWDTVTTLTVNVANSSVSFESRTDAAIIAGANAAAIGADGRWEIVQFATATKVSATQWTLSRLLRGRRGTEHVIGTSRAGDSLVMISTGDVRRVVLQQSQLGAVLDYKAVSAGKSYASGIEASFAGHAEALVPFSPVRLAATRQADGDITLTWVRRGRLGRTLMSGTDIPLSEATEAYQVDIYAGATVVRTLSVSTPLATYSAAAQAADFAGALPITELKLAVYQISAVVGRGTPAPAVLNVAA